MTTTSAHRSLPGQLSFDWITCSTTRLEISDVGPDAVLRPSSPLPGPPKSESSDEMCRARDDAHWSVYDPGHPWHYCACGDGANPIPLPSIPARAVTAEHFGVKWPKLSAKRHAVMQKILIAGRQGLVDDERRYQRLIDNGVDALSRYDREIAHGGDDELAWASAVALKYNHITWGRGKVKWLYRQLGALGEAWLAPSPPIAK